MIVKSQLVTASTSTGFFTIGRFTQMQNYRQPGAPSVTNVTLGQGAVLDSQL
jgi:hypothetical protein